MLPEHTLPVADTGHVFKRPKTATCKPELWVKVVSLGALENFSCPRCSTPDFGVGKDKKRDLTKKSVWPSNLSMILSIIAQKNPKKPTNPVCLPDDTMLAQEEQPATLR